MVNISIFVIFVLLWKSSTTTDPQVYEHVDDYIPYESNTRVVRDPFNQPRPRALQPQIFEFSAATQQDPRQARYAQQQLVDMRNFLRNQRRSRTGDLHQSASTISNETARKPVTSRKLKPSSYFDELADKIKRQDGNHIIYVNPEHSDEELKALNALVGQNPNHQLEGLKRLLEAPKSDLILPLIKGPFPTKSSASIHSLQAQLDEAAKAQLAKALADAQHQALAHVEAQHQAIAKAQEDAKRKALAQIALHNQGIKPGTLPQPLALTQAPVPVGLYAQTHNHQNKVEEVVKAPVKPSLKKISITKSHSIMQAHHSPSAYQEVVLDAPQHLGDTVHDVDDHQYAARYAFGYKIRDAKMGNEFGHEEKRDGENAKGFYHVLLPDGRMQKVEYYVDPSGYHAKVTYENLAHH